MLMCRQKKLNETILSSFLKVISLISLENNVEFLPLLFLSLKNKIKMLAMYFWDFRIDGKEWSELMSCR